MPEPGNSFALENEFVRVAALSTGAAKAPELPSERTARTAKSKRWARGVMAPPMLGKPA